MNIVLKGKEALDYITESILSVVDPVISTFGPHGKSVLIQQGGNSLLTKDGLTVARHIIPNAYNPVVENIKEAITNMEEIAGDGTTTTAVLIKALWSFFITNREALLRQFSVYEYCNHLDRAVSKAARDIQTYNIESYSNLVKTISGNDKDIMSIFEKHGDSLTTEGNISFLEVNKGDVIQYIQTKGHHISREFCYIQWGKPGVYNNADLLILDRLDLNKIRENLKEEGPLIVFLQQELYQEAIHLLDRNFKDKQLVVLFLPMVRRNMLLDRAKLDPYAAINKTKCITIDEDAGTYVHTENEEIHHIFKINESSKLLREELVRKIEDCIKVISKSGKNSCLGAGVTYTKVAIRQEGLAADMLVNALYYPRVLLKNSTKLSDLELDNSGVYDSTISTIEALKSAYKAIKPLMLTEYIILNETN